MICYSDHTPPLRKNKQTKNDKNRSLQDENQFRLSKDGRGNVNTALHS